MNSEINALKEQEINVEKMKELADPINELIAVISQDIKPKMISYCKSYIGWKKRHKEELFQDGQKLFVKFPECNEFLKPENSFYISKLKLVFKGLTLYQLDDTISIDGEIGSEVILIKLNIQSKKQEVTVFLKQLKELLCKEDFDINKDITIIRTKKKKEDERYSTPYTLLDLNYDTSDVVDRLKELSVQEYSETLVDKDDLNPPLLFVFGKNINNKQIYVKLKMKGNSSDHILCVSFHYAKEKMLFPYA